MSQVGPLTTSGIRISEVTRRSIVDWIQLEGIDWAGRFDEVAFLQRLYDLSALPSYDGRFADAEGDIWQHRVRNRDGELCWVFTDGRFELLHCPDDEFLKFLCEMVHPVVRQDEEEVQKIITQMNAYLAADGMEIAEATRVSGKAVYSARPSIPTSIAFDEARAVTDSLNSDYISQQLIRMQTAVEGDPDSAIGTAKDLVESICKSILTERGRPAKGDEDLVQLVRTTCDCLSLLPKNMPEHARGVDIIGRVLGNFANIAQGLAELRNLYGTGHGKDFKWRSAKPRHAKLAVGAASTLAVFLYETHLERNGS